MLPQRKQTGKLTETAAHLNTGLVKQSRTTLKPYYFTISKGKLVILKAGQAKKQL